MQILMQVLPWIGYVLVAVLMVLFVRWFLSLRRVVRPSEVHVVRRSKKTEIYGDTTKLNSANASGAEKLSEVAGNAYYDIPTWIPMFGVVVQKLPLNNFSVDLKGYEAYDKDKLPFVVDITAFFRIGTVSSFPVMRTWKNRTSTVCSVTARSIPWGRPAAAALSIRRKA